MLQCINACLMYKVLLRWLEKRTPTLVAALLWASHPLLVESVAWVTNLKTLTFAAALLTAILFWENHLRAPKRYYIAFSGLFAILAFGCRPEAIIIAPLILARTYWKGGWPLLRRPIYWVLPIGLAILSAIFIPFVIGSHTTALIAINDNSTITTLKNLEHYQQIFTALALQIWHIISPNNLNPAYYEEQYRAPYILISGILIAAVWLGAILITWRTKHPGGWPLTFAAICYAPASGIEYLPRFTADTYMYLPLAGLLAASITFLPQRINYRERAHFWSLLTLLVICALATSSFIQNQRWRNTITLWEPLLESTAEYGQAHFMVGIALTSVGEYDKAVKIFDEGYHGITRTLTPPVEMAVAYASAGNPIRAYEILMDILLRSDIPSDPRTDSLLVILAAKNKLNWPDKGRFNEVANKAAWRVYQARSLPQQLHSEVSKYFYHQQQDDLGKLFANTAPRSK
ncbi:hypothetical protein DN745_15085 [Bradymonas sediminis]|uniref:Glycosyltransferase RgtA/B/C/D-like domain-containing protein n=1 Tax=Bradymonas sediminis TaxID=1548548 RepID=A0A2Z4FPH9_9DELT|nr:hypothetical protein DN745_15085 [Bradymonas sediminis]